ncbi:sulfotransferase [Sphingorhabdus sp.]
MLAELAGRIGRYRDSENLLRRALELAPGFTAARSNLALVLYRQNRTSEALEMLDALLEFDPAHSANSNLKAAALGRLGDYQEAIALYEKVLSDVPGQPKIWMSYGHVLKTVGRLDESIAAYRRALEIAPMLGEVWWSLANLKTIRFDEHDISAMENALNTPRLKSEDKLHLHFALGKAFEELKQPDASFEHYNAGNMLRRAMQDHDPETTSRQVERAKASFTSAFFARHRKTGHLAVDPVFIVGMPRAGSTLIEQILSSHSMIEGTSELADIPALAARIGARGQGIEAIEAAELKSMGEEYLQRTRIHRKSDKSMFIDKLPNNWAHVGLISLILPNAKIIDARRNPMDCCFSNFKQHFARGQGFAYDLEHLGRYYSDYVDFMAHFDVEQPGRVYRVIHEQLVEDPEQQISALLDYVGVPFEDACMRFYQNDRAVRTPSSEQVRRPLNRDGFDQWRPFEAHLAPLTSALGDIVTCYPKVPSRFAKR